MAAQFGRATMTMPLVKDLMIPLSEYAVVSEDATLSEAVLALEKAVAAFDPKRSRHRAILVQDTHKQIVGKISQIDVLRALEPGYEELLKSDRLTRLGLSPMYQKSLIDQYTLWQEPLNDLCSKAAELKVKRFMQKPSEGEFVGASASLDTAIHQLIMGTHQSLLVTENDAIVGILRLSDVFMEVVKRIRAMEL